MRCKIYREKGENMLTKIVRSFAQIFQREIQEVYIISGKDGRTREENWFLDGFLKRYNCASETHTNDSTESLANVIDDISCRCRRKQKLVLILPSAVVSKEDRERIRENAILKRLNKKELKNV